MTRWRMILLGYLVLSALGGLIYWLCSGKTDPRTLALGEWKEQSSRLFVEVEPTGITARGLARGSIKYEWLQTDEEPYRLRFTYRNQSFEALISFSGKDTAIVEPQIWELLPTDYQRLLAKENKRHHRPEREMRLLFHRRPTKARGSK